MAASLKRMELFVVEVRPPDLRIQIQPQFFLNRLQQQAGVDIHLASSGKHGANLHLSLHRAHLHTVQIRADIEVDKPTFGVLGDDKRIPVKQL